MKRYTVKSLECDIAQANLNLEEQGSESRFLVGQDSGTTRVYLIDVAIYAKCGGVQRTLASGSPRECFQAIAREYFFNLVRQA